VFETISPITLGLFADIQKPDFFIHALP